MPGWCFAGQQAEVRFGWLATYLAGGVVCLDEFGTDFHVRRPVGPVPMPVPPPRPTPQTPTPSPPPTIPFSTAPYSEYTQLEGPEGAGEKMARGAYDKMTELEKGHPEKQHEWGAIIFDWNGRIFSTPLVEGISSSTGGGTAKVDFDDMVNKLPPPQTGVSIIGLVHSHPYPGAFNGPDDPDVVSANSLALNPFYRSGHSLQLRASFIAAPLPNTTLSRVYVYRPPQRVP
jgi:hypothetical protein